MTEPSLAEWDWVTDYRGRPSRERLHNLASADDPAEWEDNAGGAGVTSCGKRSDWWSIPGLFSRMSVKRCKACCDALGYPHGKGSPKNDAECRRILLRLSDTGEGE